MEPRIQRPNCKVTGGFLLLGGGYSMGSVLFKRHLALFLAFPVLWQPPYLFSQPPYDEIVTILIFPRRQLSLENLHPSRGPWISSRAGLGAKTAPRSRVLDQSADEIPFGDFNSISN